MRVNLWRLTALALLGFSLTGPSWLICNVRADEEVVPLDKLPKAVVESVKKRFPDAELVKAEKETTDGKTAYEVSLKKKGLAIDVTLSPEGQIQSIEQEIAMKDVPKVVADAFNGKHAKAKVSLIEQVIHVKDGKESLDYYEFHVVTPDNQTIEVLVTPAGTIKSEPKK